MKTLILSGSPKRNLSVSTFLGSMIGKLIKGDKYYYTIKKSNYEMIFKELNDASRVIFSMPLYVDGLPGHILPFLQQMEAYCKANDLHFDIYVIANNGFIEGKQNQVLFLQMENFTSRANLSFKGGLGIGGGVMLNVTRIMILVVLGISCINLVLTSFDTSVINDMIVNIGEVLILSSAIIGYMITLARKINQGMDFGKHYTRILVPSFIFILFADVFFMITSILQGGVFKGLFKRKLPSK